MNNDKFSKTVRSKFPTFSKKQRVNLQVNRLFSLLPKDPVLLYKIHLLDY